MKHYSFLGTSQETQNVVATYLKLHVRKVLKVLGILLNGKKTAEPNCQFKVTTSFFKRGGLTN
jgi:hypothetical protein